MKNHLKIKLLLCVIFLTPTLVHSEQDLWIDVTHSLECKDIGIPGPDGQCYFGPSDLQVSTFLTYEKKLWESVSYTWLWNHGQSKKELDSNPYYRSLK